MAWTREKRLAYNREYYRKKMADPAYRKRKQESENRRRLKRMSDPEYRARVQEQQKAYRDRPGVRERVNARVRERIENEPGYKDRVNEQHRQSAARHRLSRNQRLRERYAADPSYREKIRKRCGDWTKAKRNDDPEYRSRLNQATANWRKNNPEKHAADKERSKERKRTPEYRTAENKRRALRFATDADYAERVRIISRFSKTIRNRQRMATDPDYRKRRSENVKAVSTRNKQQLLGIKTEMLAAEGQSCKTPLTAS